MLRRGANQLSKLGPVACRRVGARRLGSRSQPAGDLALNARWTSGIAQQILCLDSARSLPASDRCLARSCMTTSVASFASSAVFTQATDSKPDGEAVLWRLAMSAFIASGFGALSQTSGFLAECEEQPVSAYVHTSMDSRGITNPLSEVTST